jgi:hypothetical protein
VLLGARNRGDYVGDAKETRAANGEDQKEAAWRDQGTYEDSNLIKPHAFAYESCTKKP